MPGIVEFPQVVQDAMADFGESFPTNASGATSLSISRVDGRRTQDRLGINGEFAATTDQSCLNRFLTAADWDVRVLNERRLEDCRRIPSPGTATRALSPSTIR